MPYMLIALPLVVAATMSALWWSVLARPWIFLATGIAALYGVIALAVVIGIFIGPRFGGYFLEPPSQQSQRSASSLDSFDAGVIVGIAVFLIVGFALLWGLKVWLSKP